MRNILFALATKSIKYITLPFLHKQALSVKETVLTLLFREKKYLVREQQKNMTISSTVLQKYIYIYMYMCRIGGPEEKKQKEERKERGDR